MSAALETLRFSPRPAPRSPFSLIHDFGISSIQLRSSLKLRLYLLSFAQWPLRASSMDSSQGLLYGLQHCCILFAFSCFPWPSLSCNFYALKSRVRCFTLPRYTVTSRCSLGSWDTLSFSLLTPGIHFTRQLLSMIREPTNLSFFL